MSYWNTDGNEELYVHDDKNYKQIWNYNSSRRLSGMSVLCLTHHCILKAWKERCMEILKSLWEEPTLLKIPLDFKLSELWENDYLLPKIIHLCHSHCWKLIQIIVLKICCGSNKSLEMLKWFGNWFGEVWGIWQ